MSKIIEMAREAGFVAYGEDMGEYRIPTQAMHSRLERFAAMVAADERERCAQACDERGNRMLAAAVHPGGDRDEFYCADDILHQKARE